MLPRAALQEPQGLSAARELLLASVSPRRRELLLAAGLPVRLVRPGDETAWRRGEDARAHALAQAEAKALGAEVGGLDGMVLAADTVVVVGDRCLGKPGGRSEAARFLDLLAGSRHTVATAHAWAPVVAGRVHAGGLATELTTAEVAVVSLTPAQRRSYLDSMEWQDKAGGYGIQGAFGSFARLVNGDLDTVIGLSLRVALAAWSSYLERDPGD